MLDPVRKIANLLREDRRYAFEAYVFVFEALRFAQEQLGMGVEVPEQQEAQPRRRRGRSSKSEAPRHLTGQELCEAIRRYALQQYGYMAKCVLNQWGVHTTGDFGEIVFNLIRIGEMRKTDDDRREDFNDVFDFDQGLTKQFEIKMDKDEG